MLNACYAYEMSNVQVKHLDAEVHDLLRERAVATGLTISDYVLELIRRDLQLPPRRQWLSQVASLPRHDFTRAEVTDLRRYAQDEPDLLSRLVNRTDVVVGDSSDFIHLDWSGEWQG